MLAVRIVVGVVILLLRSLPYSLAAAQAFLPPNRGMPLPITGRGGGSSADDDDDDDSSSLSQGRDLEALREWGLAQGVSFSEDVRLERDPRTAGGDWGVVSELWSNLADDEKVVVYKNGLTGETRVGRMKVDKDTPAADNNVTLPDEDFGVLMKIPPHLVLSSTMLDKDKQQKLKESLTELGATGEKVFSAFCLTLVFLEEWSKGEASIWFPYLKSLPKKLTSGLYWDDTEREYAKKLGMKSFLEDLGSLWGEFQARLGLFCPDHIYDVQLVKWAFSICYSRSWNAAYKTDTGDDVSNLVCFGDVFNHNAGYNVIYSQESAESPVTMVLVEPPDDDSGSGLYMSYFETNDIPPRFPGIFGFCDTSEPTWPAVTIINSFSSSSALFEAAKIFGSVVTRSMVFSTSDGAISDRVWNAVLYRILLFKLHDEQSEEERQHIRDGLDALYKACRKKPHGPTVEKADSLDTLHKQYEQEVAQYLLHEMDSLITLLGPVPAPMDERMHPSWDMLREFHKHQRDIYLRVRCRAKKLLNNLN